MGIELRNVEGLAEPAGYSHVAVASGARLVFTAGAVPLDAQGELVGPEDAEVQAEQVLTNLLPAPSTMVGVALLGYGGQLVEIEAIAVVAGDRSPG